MKNILLGILTLFFSIYFHSNLQAQAPVNDNVCNALNVPDDGIGLLLTTDQATVQAGEDAITPPLSTTDCETAWCDPLGFDGSVWFSFVAPASGAVDINICGSDYDTQLAAYAVGNCADFSSFTFIAASDDTANGVAGSECGPPDPNTPGYGLASILHLECLTAGQTYYVVVDEWTTAAYVGGVLDIKIEGVAATSPGVVISSVDTTTPTCVGDSDGTALVNFTGTSPFSILWDTGETTALIGGLSEGQTVTVTVSDFCNQSATESATVGTVVVTPLLTDVGALDAYCGQGYGSVKPSGGFAPFTYNWSNGATTPLTVLDVGSYTVTIVDNCGMSTVETIEVNGMADAGPDVSLMTGGFLPLGSAPTAFSVVKNSATYSLDQTIGGGVACRNGGLISDNGMFRIFDVGDINAGAAFTIDEVEVGILSAISGDGTGFQPLTCNLYTTDNTDLSIANLTLVQSLDICLPDISAAQLWSFPMNYTIPANESVVVEIFNPNGVDEGHTFTIGVNESATLNNNPTWIRSEGCGIITPTLFADIGFYDELVVNLVQYDTYTGGFTYNWTPTTDLDDATLANPTVTPTVPGTITYTVVVTDDNGCTGSDQVDVTLINPCSPATPLVLNEIVVLDVNCDGYASADLTSASLPVSYLWSNGDTGALAYLGAGDHTVTITDACGQQLTESITISSIADAGPDVNLTGGTSPIGGSPTGNSVGFNSLTYSLDQTFASGVACRGGGFISDNNFYRTFDLSTDFGINVPYEINEIEVAIFNANAGDGSGFQPLTCKIYSATSADLYTATLTFIDSVAVNLPDIATPQMWRFPISYTIPAGQIIVAEIANPNGIAAGNLLSLGVNETATLNNNPTWISSEGCAITSPTLFADIGFYDELVINLNQYVPYTGTYTYLWSPGTDLSSTTVPNPNVSPGQSGTICYTVLVTDDNGCTGTDEMCITNTTVCTPPSLNTASTDAACGQNIGTATANATGGTAPYTYEWGNGATTQTITGLGAGTYTVIVTDAASCAIADQATVNATDAAAATATVTSTSCGQDNGQIDLTISAGQSPFSFSWSNGATTEDLVNLASGSYTGTATDANGCTVIVSEVVNSSSAAGAAAVVANTSCAQDNGAIDLTVNAGQLPFTFLWSNGEITEDLADLPAGAYTVTATDANGCTVILSETVNTSSDVMAATTSTTVSCNGGSDGAIDLSINAGQAPFTYLWSNGATSDDLAGLPAGTYTGTVTDANNCTTTVSETITEPTALALGTPIVVDEMGNDGSGSISAPTPSGGISPYNYLWSNGELTSSISNLSEGDYFITITDANGCAAIGGPYTVTDIVAIGSVEGLNSLSIQPNPTTDKLSINLSLDRTMEVELTLYSVTGRLITAYNDTAISTRNYELSIGDYPAGVYLVKLTINGQLLTRKIVLLK